VLNLIISPVVLVVGPIDLSEIIIS
jgi:hypothetical protein